MRHAEVEEWLSQEKFMQSIKDAFAAAGHNTFEYSDVLKILNH